MSKQKISFFWQTRALLWKNLLVKWRIKKESLLEWLFPLILLLLQFLFISIFPELKLVPELPAKDLGSIDAFSDPHLVCAYTPLTPTTKAIMKIMATASFMKDAKVIPVEDLETLDTYSQQNHSEIVGIIFKDTFSYQLKFSWGYRVPFTDEFIDHAAHCTEYEEEIFTCAISTFWNYGFIPFQASLNAAIIEVTTNHSVMKDLMSITGITMKVESFVAQHGVMYDFCIFFSVISFSPFTYFLSLNVTRERKRLKELMKLMGLQDTAFWLSWGLLYAGYVSIVATFLALMTSRLVYTTGFFTIFSLFILYGLSLIALTFLLSVLIRKPVLTGLTVFLLTLFWGCLGILILYRKLPVSLEWILSFLSPFAFTAGMMILLDNDPQGDSSLMMATFVMLLLDTVLYMALALYFDKLLPGDYGHRHSPLFFLKSWFWSPNPRSGRVFFENENNHIHSSDDSFEPVSPEFHGKEAIRIKNIKKEYKKKAGKVEAFLHVNETCNSERITSLIQQHIPDAKLAGRSEEKLVYTLPLERTDKFPGLYSDLDGCTDQGIVNYGVSMTTLNEVFLKLEGKTAVDEAGILGQEPGGDGRLSESEQASSRLPEMKREVLSGLALWRQQFRTVARIRFLKLKCERRPLYILFFIVGISFLPLILEHLLLKIFFQPHVWPLNPGLYFLSSGQKPHAHLTHLLILNNTGSPIEDLIHSLERQNIMLDVDDFASKNGTYDPSHNGAIVVSRQEMVSFSLFSFQRDHALQFNICTTATQTNPYHCPSLDCELVVGRECICLLYCTLPTSISPYIGMSSIGDCKLKIRSRLHLSGLFPSAYWFGQAAVDMPLNLVILLCMSAPNYFLALNRMMLPTRIIFTLVMVACIIGCTASIVMFMYVVSFMSRKRSSSDFWCLCFFVISLFSFMLFLQFNFPSALMLSCIILVPFCTLIGCTIFFFHPCLHCLIFLFTLRCLEAKEGKKMMTRDPIFRIYPRSNSAYPSLGDPEGEDDDVLAERARTANALDSSDKPVIIASCLCKEYEVQKRNCFSKRKKKVASRNVSFCVKQGEVLGLLGHSGAGKSTLLRMIVGETAPSAGKVVSGSVRGDKERRFPGYCPQAEALWPDFTVREHLEVYAAVKGMTKEDTSAAITRYFLMALELQEHLKVPVKKLSVGINRKLCFALSMLGNPTVILLDEPSIGMDPKGQQQMWQMILATCKSKENGAILSTHNMAEAEAVCDRVAIVVAGQLRFIGSIQHLKSKFGRDYVLEMKAKQPGQMEALHAEILRLFPQAVRKERYSSLIVYKLPMNDVCPLSSAFLKLEEGKSDFLQREKLDFLSPSLFAYQVFLELTMEQDPGDFDEELEPTVKWKLLPSEDP
uniref:ABC transporter domain-containing protein n=1 Tax=Ornithorhynchus anatinus TaxID=9258 RepID=A0A6I8N5J4_ORNAN